jgi:hypothetical protein
MQPQGGDDHTHKPPTSTTDPWIVLATVATTVLVILVILQHALPNEVGTPSLRLVLAVGAGVLWLVADRRRSEARLLAKLEHEKSSDDYIHGYVDGVSRRSPGEGGLRSVS